MIDRSVSSTGRYRYRLKLKSTSEDYSGKVCV